MADEIDKQNNPKRNKGCSCFSNQRASELLLLYFVFDFLNASLYGRGRKLLMK